MQLLNAMVANGSGKDAYTDAQDVKISTPTLRGEAGETLGGMIRLGQDCLKLYWHRPARLDADARRDELERALARSNAC